MATDNKTVDKLYSVPRKKVDKFSFDEKVAEVFPDMLKRSVPGYEQIINMIGVLTRRYVQPNSNIYDLGCSLGASSFIMQNNIEHNDCALIGIDNSQAMIDKAQQINGEPNEELCPINFICQDIMNTNIDNASIVNLNFTLQFIQPQHRQQIIDKIFKGLKPGGILILSEKIQFADTENDKLQIALHHTFKKANGYSDLEISQKRSSLEKVLIPDTHEQHIERLKNSGFSQASAWFQCFNFFSYIAIKAS